VKLAERLDSGDVKPPPTVLVTETHKTDAAANGVVGSQNQCGRYVAGAVLWTSDRFHERTATGGNARSRAADAKTLKGKPGGTFSRLFCCAVPAVVPTFLRSVILKGGVYPLRSTSSPFGSGPAPCDSCNCAYRRRTA